jgi:hypothetical protein
MSTQFETIAAPHEVLVDEYRAVSSFAVASLALGLLSALALFDWWMLALPAVAITLGLFALRQIRRRGEELTGGVLAKIGVAFAVVFLVAGASLQSYVYATELPPGYARISFTQLRATDRDSIDPPDTALPLEGKKVFIKGFMYPSSQMDGITTFLLAGDSGTCCFGGNPTITDRIQVTLDNPRGVSYSARQFKVAGVFHVQPLKDAINAPGAVLYHLEGATIR